MFSAILLVALAQNAFAGYLPLGSSNVNEVSVSNAQSAYSVVNQPSLALQSLPSYSQSSILAASPAVSVTSVSAPQQITTIQSPAYGRQSSSLAFQSQPAYGFQSAAYSIQTPTQAAGVSVIPSAPTTVQLLNNNLNEGVLLTNNNGGGQGGIGYGQVEVLGQLPLVGETNVLGSLPIQGLVGFGGTIPAGGIVNIYGSVPCSC